tara:strand:+ start:2013 stop:2468 length:456 start_codon:yes stop_codon:yes gene_type:complete
MANFLENSNYDLIAGMLEPKCKQRAWSVGLFEKIDDTSKPIIVNIKKTYKKINNIYLNEVYDTNLALNIFMAKTDKLKQSPWNNKLKVGEHKIFFYNWFKNNNSCAICYNCYFGQVSNKNRKYFGNIKQKYRNRALPNNNFSSDKLIKFIF